jgi:hypothetical protein
MMVNTPTRRSPWILGLTWAADGAGRAWARAGIAMARASATKAPAAATAALTRRRAPVLCTKCILISLWIDLPQGRSCPYRCYEPQGRIGLVQASTNDSTPLLGPSVTRACSLTRRRALDPTPRPFLIDALSHKTMLYAPGIDETADDLTTVVDAEGDRHRSAGNIYGRNDTLVQQKAMGLSVGITINAYHLATIVDA